MPLPITPAPKATPTSSFLHHQINWTGFANASLDTLWDVGKLVIIFAVLRFVLQRLVDRVIFPIIERGEEIVDAGRTARVRTLAGLVNSALSYVLIFVFGVMLLRAFRLDPIPLLTTASVAGLAVGFGAQKLVKDVISGFFILLENQYAVGDFVTIGSVTGTVEMVGMRTTRIRDESGKLYFLSNGDISQVCNQSRGAVATFVEIGVAPATDISKATEIINAAGEELAKNKPDLRLSHAPSVQGLGAMDAAKLTLRVACPVTQPAHLTDAQIALRGLAHQRLTEAGIALA